MFFFFQAEDGIRDFHVTGVQTCALPILYYVMVQLDPSHRATPSDMSGIYLRGRGQQLVQLAALAKVEEGVGPRQINHFNRVPSFTLSASLVPPFAQGEALDSLDRLARRVLPPGSTTALAGDSREFRESGGALYFAFGVALLVVFMVLAAQFESLVHPLTVLFVVPVGYVLLDRLTAREPSRARVARPVEAD